MSQNPLSELTQQLINFFVIWPENGDIPRYERYGDLIRYHNENLIQSGDLSIASSKFNWQCFTQRQGLQLRRQTEQMLPDEQSVQQLLDHSKQWIFPLLNVNMLRKERYALRFQRAPIISHVLHSILIDGDDYGKHKKSTAIGVPTLCLTLNTGNTKELHKFRATQLFHIVRRMLDYANWRLVAPEQKTDDTLLVSIESNNQPRCLANDQPDKMNVRVLCGPVLEPIKKTGATLTSDSYMALRSNDMLLIAMHRHGLRDCARDKDIEGLLQRLGHATVIVDLFEVRHASGATVVRNGSGSSKGASYILYNSARLETLLRTFAAQVDAGAYEPLPPLDKIDLSLLEDELDWQMLYGYLLTFPNLVESTLSQLKHGQCAVHLIVRYIVDLASLFSRYYRSKQILVQKRSNLMPTLYARIYLVKAVRQVLNSALALLGIQPVDYM
ncbi:DALR anticodon-binding domain-containing protein 3 [Drosophila grimshawi]|uniref:GH12874 n=1 Tax=Drosophila grimshawi TaxID=7222 RepID=B4JLJ4_DROGR|nr:DALR anticodon-binding domain-containing protein 3 [Drosophila grimshawi]EDW00447.1 GH12874 [Drosophila grimshawi]